MIEINKIIMKKLDGFDDSIKEIAIKAIRLSQDQSPNIVSEQIDALIKKNINNRQ